MNRVKNHLKKWPNYRTFKPKKMKMTVPFCISGEIRLHWPSLNYRDLWYFSLKKNYYLNWVKNHLDMRPTTKILRQKIWKWPYSFAYREISVWPSLDYRDLWCFSLKRIIIWTGLKIIGKDPSTLIISYLPKASIFFVKKKS